MTDEKFGIIGAPIIRMKIAPEARGKCTICGIDVGCTRATYNSIPDDKKKELEFICQDCFLKQGLLPGDSISPFSKAQLKELRDAIGRGMRYD